MKMINFAIKIILHYNKKQQKNETKKKKNTNKSLPDDA